MRTKFDLGQRVIHKNVRNSLRGIVTGIHIHGNSRNRIDVKWDTTHEANYLEENLEPEQVTVAEGNASTNLLEHEDVRIELFRESSRAELQYRSTNAAFTLDANLELLRRIRDLVDYAIDQLEKKT